MASANVQAGEENAPAPAHANRPPKFLPGPELRPVPSGDGGGGLGVRAGKTLHATVAAEDPDGDAVVYRVRGLPKGAAFDERSGVFTWTPATDALGNHDVTFEASDGKLSATRTTRFVVRPNHPPRADDQRKLFFVAGRPPSPGDLGETPLASDRDTTFLFARDPDEDDLTVSVEQRPPGVNVRSMGYWANVSWQPTDADVGEHKLVVLVSDGELTTRVERTLVVIPEWADSDYHGWLLLGGGPSGFIAHDDGELFLGGALDVSLVALSGEAQNGILCADGERTQGCHASHHRFYAEFEILDSTKSGSASLFTYGAGYSASFEYAPLRRFLIPHYGVELGGLVQDELGHRVQTRPYLGLHFWADRRVWLNVAVGYRVVPAELEDLSGPTATLRAVINPW